MISGTATSAATPTCQPPAQASGSDQTSRASPSRHRPRSKRQLRESRNLVRLVVIEVLRHVGSDKYRVDRGPLVGESTDPLRASKT